MPSSFFGSQFCIVETVVTAVMDQFPEKLKGRKTLVVAAYCAISFLLGLNTVTQVRGGRGMETTHFHTGLRGVTLPWREILAARFASTLTPYHSDFGVGHFSRWLKSPSRQCNGS